MSITLQHQVALTALSLVLGTCAFAGESAAVSHRCATINNATERLACYDGAFPRSFETPVAPVDSAARVDALREFGLSKEQLRQREPERMRELTPERITGKITGVDYRGTGERVVTLDNGQVWLLTEVTSRGPLKPGDAVEVRRAALGSFMLVTSARVRLRARRIK